MTKHQLADIRRNEDGSYTGVCSCGHVTTGKTAAEEPDIEARKDSMYEPQSRHFLEQPEIRRIVGLGEQ